MFGSTFGGAKIDSIDIELIDKFGSSIVELILFEARNCSI
jgi:hypothetical protein